MAVVAGLMAIQAATQGSTAQETMLAFAVGALSFLAYQLYRWGRDAVAAG